MSRPPASPAAVAGPGQGNCGCPQLSYPTNEDMQIARSSFLQLAAALEAAARGKSLSSSVEALRWSLRGLQDVGKLLLLLLQQQQRCRTLLSHSVWPAAAEKVSAACRSYTEEFLPQMLLLHTVETQLQEQEPQQQQHTLQQQMLQLARELQLLQLSFMHNLLEQEPTAAPVCATPIAMILSMHSDVWYTGASSITSDADSNTKSLQLNVVIATFDLLQKCGATLLQETLAASGRLSSRGTAAVADYIGGAAACTRGFAALSSIRSHVHEALVRLPLLLAPADTCGVPEGQQQQDQDRRAAAARCMRSCLSVLASWAEVLHSLAEDPGFAASASRGQQQPQHALLLQPEAAHAEQLLRHTAAAWEEADTQLLLKLLLQPPHIHTETPATTPVALKDKRVHVGGAAASAAAAASAVSSTARGKALVNPLVYGEVLQTAIWICCRLPRRLCFFLQPLIQIADVLRGFHQQVVDAAAAEDNEDADSSTTTDIAVAGGTGCGVRCVATAAAVCGGSAAVHALLLLLQREGLRLLASPRCSPAAALLLLDAAGRRAPARFLQREANAKFQSMWASTRRSSSGSCSSPPLEETAAEMSLPKKRRIVEASSDSSSSASNGSAAQEKEERISAAAAAESVAAASADAAAASRVLLVAETDAGAWRSHEQQVDATSLLLDLYNPQRLTAILIQGLQRGSTSSNGRGGSSSGSLAATTRACAPAVELLRAAEARLQVGDNRRSNDGAPMRASFGEVQHSLPALFELQDVQEEPTGCSTKTDESSLATSFAPRLSASPEAYMELLAAQVLGGPLPECLPGSNAYADRLLFLQWRQQIFLRLAERMAEPMKDALLLRAVRAIFKNEEALQVSPQETSGSTPLFVLQAKLALSLDLLFFISSRSCSNYIKQRQLRLSQAASELGAAATTDAQPTLTLALIGKLPEAVEGWHPWRFLVKGSWVTSTFTTYEKAFAECLSMAYCQELLDDTALRAAYSQLMGRFLVASPLVPPSVFAFLAWLADGEPPAAAAAAADAAGAATAPTAASASLHEQQNQSLSVQAHGEAGIANVDDSAMQVCTVQPEHRGQQPQMQLFAAADLVAACGLSESRSAKALANDRRLVVAALSQIIRRKNAPLSRRTAFTLLMRLCHVGSVGCRRLFSRLFASVKGTYTPPADSWKQQTIKDLLLRHKVPDAAPSTVVTQGSDSQISVRAPQGAPLWQMPARLLQQSGLKVLQEPELHQGDVAATAAAAASAASAEGASEGALSSVELQGWGSPEYFSGRWVEEVASLVFASAGGPGSVEALLGLMRISAFPAAVASTLLREISTVADAGEAAAAAAVEAATAATARETIEPPDRDTSAAAEGEDATDATAASAALATALKAKAAAAAAAFDMRSSVFAVIAARNPFLLHLLLRVALSCSDSEALQRHEQLLLQIIKQINDLHHQVYPQLIELHLPEQRPLLLTMLQHLAAATAVAQQNGENLPVRLLEATWAVFKADKNFSLVAPMVRFFTREQCHVYIQQLLLSSEDMSLVSSVFADLMRSRYKLRQQKQQQRLQEYGISPEDLLLCTYMLPCPSVAERRRQAAALDVCLGLTGALPTSPTSEELLPVHAVAAVCQRLSEDSETPLQPVFGRLLCRAAQHLPSLGEFLSSVVFPALIAREAWQSQSLWKGVSIAVGALWPSHSETLLQHILRLPQEAGKPLLQQLQQRLPITAELSALLAQDPTARQHCPPYLQVLLGLAT